MAIDWKNVRYRGDAQDVEVLFDTYRVGDYLDTYEENRRQRDLGLREKLLKSGIKLTERLSPRIYRLYEETCGALELTISAEVFCLPDPQINAFAVHDVKESGEHFLVGVTAGALERLEDAELKAILGHEMGHFLFGNNRLNALISMDRNNPSATVLPAFGESLFLRWRKKAEISADRVGLLASGDFHAASRSLLKATFGLSERNLNLDIDALLAQIDEIKDHPEMIESTFASHPILPIRLKSLELFSRSAKAQQGSFTVEGSPLPDDELEDGVDEMIQLTRRYPHLPLAEAVMRVTAMGGALVLGADKDVNDDEVKVLIQTLHRWFTDEPEDVIVVKREEIDSRLPEAVAIVNKKGGPDDKAFILSRLAEIALADGALVDVEGAVVLRIAEELEIPPRRAYGIMVGAAQAVGFRSDVRLNQMAESLRDELRMGFGIHRPAAGLMTGFAD
jgi:uncharacterized tellurite resistance protein B-like protein